VHSATAAPITRTGKITITVSLKVGASIPNGTRISKYPSLDVADATYRNYFGQSVSSTVAGGTAKAVVTIPYRWVLASATDKVTVGAQILNHTVRM
jgi:hypothetical protein